MQLPGQQVQPCCPWMKVSFLPKKKTKPDIAHRSQRMLRGRRNRSTHRLQKGKRTQQGAKIWLDPPKRLGEISLSLYSLAQSLSRRERSACAGKVRHILFRVSHTFHGITVVLGFG